MTISRQLTLFFVISWIATVLVLGWLLISYRIAQTESLLIESEQQLVSQHAHEMQVRFDEIPRAHRAAQELHAFWRASLSQSEVDARFSAAFVRHSDGTWRSRDILFDAQHEVGLGHVGGIAAFISPGSLDKSRKRDLVSALASITALAPGQRQVLDSLWYMSPQGDIIIFAPDRKDRLAFYRKNAPASSDFRSLPFIKAVLPDRNPQGRTLCTGLDHAVYDATGATLITSCQTPAPTNTGEIPVWGTSLLMNQRLAQIVGTTAGGRTVALAASDGSLIAAPGMMGREGAPASLVAKLTRDLRWPSIQPNLAGMAATGVINKANMPWLVTFARVAGPDWLLVHFRDRNFIARQLSADLPLLALMALLLLVSQVVIVLVFIRRRISGPLKAIANRYAANTKLAAGHPIRFGLPAEIRALDQQLNAAWLKIEGLMYGLEERVADRTAELAAALKVAENANKAINAFLANVSHEIRTPLNGVVSLSALLLKSDMPAQQREMVKIIQASSESLKLVVTDILDASKLEAGKLDLQLEPCNLRKIIVDACRSHAVAAEEKGVSFVIDHHTSADGDFLCDAQRIRQILGNLASNAVKFTDHGEIRVTVHAEISADGKFGVVEVSDTGIGFDAAFSARIFGRFEQADTALTRRTGGTGLGLWISRGLAELMDGSLSARSTPGAGSCFTLRLPLKAASPAAEPALQEGEMDPPYPPGGHTQGLQVLVVEDHERNRHVMTILLEQIGALVTCAADGAEAMLRFKSNRYDLVLMDMQMPDLDGLTVTTMMREREKELKLRQTPIVMVTANTLPEHVARAISAGCDALLAKPVVPDDLYSLIAKLTIH